MNRWYQRFQQSHALFPEMRCSTTRGHQRDVREKYSFRGDVFARAPRAAVRNREIRDRNGSHKNNAATIRKRYAESSEKRSQDQEEPETCPVKLHASCRSVNRSSKLSYMSYAMLFWSRISLDHEKETARNLFAFIYYARIASNAKLMFTGHPGDPATY